MRQKLLAGLLSLTMTVWSVTLPVTTLYAQEAPETQAPGEVSQSSDTLSVPESGPQGTGPQNPTGPTGPTGVQNLTGPQVPTGPIGPTGPQTQTGAQAPVVRDCTDPAIIAAGYCRGRNQGANQGKDQGQQQGQAQGEQQGLHQNDPNAPVAATTATPAASAQSNPALGATGSAAGTLTNEQTGAGSTNTNDVTHDRTLDVTETNTATIDNTVDVGASTGGNTLNRNTSVGSLTTGEIQGSVSLVNVANSVFAPGSSAGIGELGVNAQGDLVLLQSDDRAYLPTNSRTGADSTNTNTISGTDVIRILTENIATVDNDIDIAADTGSNTLTDNSILGNILTGSIDLAVNLINLLNLTMPDTVFELDIWSIFGDLIGDIQVEGRNAQTGAGSTNTNTISNTTTVDATVTNTATIDNVFDIATETGANALDRNTTVGDVTTGNVEVEGNVTNIANVGTPTLYLVNVLGTWTGGSLGLPAGSFIINELGNALTGAGSTNTNTVDQTTDVDVDVTNTATVANRIGIDASTGGNTIARNTTVGDVRTGDIKILANVVNFLNSAASQFGKFSLGIINVFGDWKPVTAKPTIAAQQASSSPSSTPSPALAGQVAVLAQAAPQASGQGGGSVNLAGTLLPAASDLPPATAQTSAPSNQAVSVTTPESTPNEQSASLSAHTRRGASPVASTQTLAALSPSVAAATLSPDTSLQVASVTENVGSDDAMAATVNTASQMNWQLILVIALGVGFLMLWGTVEVFAYKRGR